MGRPEDRVARRGLYPPNWGELRFAVLLRAHNMCEGSPAYPNCRAEDRNRHPVTGSRVILTVAHLDRDPKNNESGNLRVMCQRCHLTYDASANAFKASITKRLRRDVSGGKQ